MAVSKRIRFEVFKRDLFTCKYCGKRPPEVVLHVDHIVARAKGGSDDPDNLVTSCSDCNLGKSDRGLGETLPAVGEMERLAAIQEMSERAELLRYEQDVAQREREVLQVTVSQLLEEWIVITGDEEGFEDAGIALFTRKGLLLSDLYVAMDATKMCATKKGYMSCWKLWKYFCGCCWRMIREKGPE